MWLIVSNAVTTGPSSRGLHQSLRCAALWPACNSTARRAAGIVLRLWQI